VTLRWKKNVRHLTRVPELHDLGKRFRPEWLTEFLLEPRDLRPHLEETMPRFAISREEAAQIAAWLTRDAPGAAAEAALPPATWQRGRDVYQDKRCAQCHEFTGIVPGDHPEGARDESFETARRLAPDLRFARDRMTRPAIARWLGDRTPVWPLRLMPAVTLSPEEIEALSAFILESPLEPVAVQPAEPRLPLLTRAVTYDEVEKEVLHRTCWHCHAEPNYARGDGGPGNTGGFGFAGMRINFLGYETILAGYRDPKGEPASLFRKNAEGVPRLVEALLARQDEERGHPRAEVRGMPLGLPSLRPEQIQLVETWIAQGRRR
jgi:mono/diheme cytochrome c family protein